MISSQAMNQRTTANGVTEVNVTDAPATGKTRMVIAVRVFNADTIAHTFILKDAAGEFVRVAGVPAGATEGDFGITNSNPVHLEAAETLIGDQLEATTTTEPRWRTDFFEGTD